MTSGHEQSDNTPSSAPDLPRRALLGKAIAAGTIVWTTPLITSQVAGAADGTCTPKCLPNITGFSTAPAIGSFNLPNCQYAVTLTPAVNCPCGGTQPAAPVWTWGTPTGSNPGGGFAPFVGYYAAPSGTTTLTLPIAIRWYETFTVSGTVQPSCSDRAGDVCATTFNWTITANRTIGLPGTCPNIPSSSISISFSA